MLKVQKTFQLQPPERQEPGPIRLLVDVDAGIDDAWALFMLLRAHENPAVDLRIEAITTVNGNTPVDNVLVNVTRVLLAARVLGIPVYRGAESAMAVKHINDPPYYGEDGFGDPEPELDPVDPVVSPGHAVDKIIELAREYSGQLTALALGPLTNFALAVNRAPELFADADGAAPAFAWFVILGGSAESYGNVTPTAEFNFFADVEAARVVLERFKCCPMTVVPRETWRRFATSTYSFRVDDLGTMDTPQIRLMNRAEAKHLENNKETWGVPDALAAAVLLEPSRIVTRSETHYCTVELHGELTRGMLVVDREGHFGQPPNVEIVTEVEKELYERMLRTAAGGEYYQP